MKTDTRALTVLKILKELYPEPKPALNYTSPFQLLIATILSAQCTDARVNIVTEGLFKKYRKPEDYLAVSADELEKDIFSTGFYRQKAKSIRECCTVLLEKYRGQVPADFEALVGLPGVGRKTASVVAGNAFGTPAIAVDTHVKRLSNLLGFVESGDPEKIESELKKIFPEKEWVGLSHRLAAHGRTTCFARNPKCSECLLTEHCPAAFSNLEKVKSGKKS